MKKLIFSILFFILTLIALLFWISIYFSEEIIKIDQEICEREPLIVINQKYCESKGESITCLAKNVSDLGELPEDYFIKIFSCYREGI